MPTAEYESVTLTSNAIHGSLPPLLRIAMKWKRLIWITMVATIVMACAVALLLPKHYTATVVLLPPQQSGSTGSAMMAQLSNLGAMASAAGSMSIKNPNDQQVALLKSRTVEDAIVERFHLQALYHRKYLSTTRKYWERKTEARQRLEGRPDPTLGNRSRSSPGSGSCQWVGGRIPTIHRDACHH